MHADKLKPLVKAVRKASGAEAHAMLFTVVSTIVTDMEGVLPKAVEQAGEIRTLITVGSAKNIKQDGFGMALSEKLDKLHTTLVEFKDAKLWAKFTKKMDAAAKKAATKKIREGKAIQFSRKDHGSDSEESRGKGNGSHSRGRGEYRQRQSGGSYERDDRDGPSMTDVRAFLKSDGNKAPHSEGCWGCGGDHNFNKNCPEFADIRKRTKEWLKGKNRKGGSYHRG